MSQFDRTILLVNVIFGFLFPISNFGGFLISKFSISKKKGRKKMEFQIVISKKRPKTFSHEYLLGIERDEVRMMAWEIEEGRLERVVPRQCYFTGLSIHPGPSIVLLM